MLDYLAAHFAPRPVAAHIVATAGSEAIYKRACLTCHEDDLIEAQRLTRAGWMREVEKMIRWGADVPRADKERSIGLSSPRSSIPSSGSRYPPRDTTAACPAGCFLFSSSCSSSPAPARSSIR